MRALLVLDMQNDFTAGGTVPVPDGDRVTEAVNEVMDKFELIVATQEWHPATHCSFASRHPDKHPGDEIEINGVPQRLWPDHCVQRSLGAEFVPGLNFAQFKHIQRKGDDPKRDSYSAFFDNAGEVATGLADWLKDNGVDELYLAGLPLDVSVHRSALDARRLGMKTHLVRDAAAPLDPDPEHVAEIMRELEAADVMITTVARV